MLTEPTDEELAKAIDSLEWLIAKRKDGDTFKRELEVRLFCIRSTRDALTSMRARSQEGGVPEK